MSQATAETLERHGHAFTRLLLEWKEGNREALDELTPIVYAELRNLAHSYMNNEPRGHVLQTTALVHEAYLRLAGLELDWKNRQHFVGVCAGLMRRVLVDYARRFRAEKRGGGEMALSLDDVQVTVEPTSDLLVLDEALRDLAEFDERKARIVELRFFGGMTIDETAAFLSISHATVERDFKLAKAWLHQRLQSPDTASSGA